MAYADLDGIHVPAAGNRPPASWGLQVNANFDAIYDDVLAKLGVWTSWTPSVVQSSSVSKTVAYGRYLKLGRLVICQTILAITGSGSSATAITVSVPVTAANGGNLPCGSGFFYEATGNVSYPLTVLLKTTGTFGFYTTASSIAQLGETGSASNVALASGDSINLFATYEAAS